MKLRITEENTEAENLIPPAALDGSRIGVNHADAYIKAMNVDLEDGRKVTCKRRGLELTLAIGKQVGKGLKARNGTTVIDGGGRTLMPGLIDGHAHLMINGHADYPIGAITCSA